MAQEIAEFTSLDDLDRLFCSFWPKFTDGTKTALLSELRPYLRRCATLLPQLEPRLFRTKATEKPACSTPPSNRLTTQPVLPTQSLSSTTAPPPSPPPKYLPGLPENVAGTLSCTSASAFFQRDEKRCMELYQAMVQGDDTLWLNVIEQRFRYLGLYILQNSLMNHGCGKVFYYTANSAKRKITDVAALHNPTISRSKISTNIDRYIARGKMYWELMQEFSISTVVSLSPEYLNFYERRKTNELHRIFLSDLRREGAKTTAEFAQLTESARTLETTAQRYLDWICANYWVWLAGPKRKHNCDNGEVISCGEANKRRRRLTPDVLVTGFASAVLDGQPFCRETVGETVPQSTTVPRIRSLDVLADTALLSVHGESFLTQTSNTDAILLPKPGMAIPGLSTTSCAPSPNPLPTPPASYSTAALIYPLSTACLLDSSSQSHHPLSCSSGQESAIISSQHGQKGVYDEDEPSTREKQKSMSTYTIPSLNCGAEAAGAGAERWKSINADLGEGAESTDCSRAAFATSMPDSGWDWDWTEVLAEYSGWEWNDTIPIDTTPDPGNQFRDEDLNFGLSLI